MFTREKKFKKVEKMLTGKFKNVESMLSHDLGDE